MNYWNYNRPEDVGESVGYVIRPMIWHGLAISSGQLSHFLNIRAFTLAPHPPRLPARTAVGIAGSADVPTLNLMGFEDEYFGANNSGAGFCLLTATLQLSR